ncbi:phage baseplate assembly protein V [Desulfobacca acetoxidans]|uniref:Gp5/Type VI secretion system Vgr protein OB-fold domain-containing protein n=1 Tax=Desulfobacca acetoxidans (strain ATCC 700848 / DSM 11109 / ASRB2) TaxID=880072 RepID=F2NI27_DESAR|nr:phage baseplate assembly protein V [Desulfobacca acetoxidans]AEB09653.1 hypothetical protein Desac_1813 [Desulfobacca acetoxidans DSM 11109]
MLLDNYNLDAVVTWIRSHYFGKYAGRVTDTNDPLGKGRLKVEVPDVFADGTAVWAMPCVPYAGDQVGFKSFPPVGSNVWIEFEKGDISYPVWVGFFWGDGEMPSEAGQDDNVKLWKTGAFTITIDDQAEEMVITANSGATLTISTEIKAEVSSSTATVATGGITLEGSGKKVEVTQVSVKINDGALEVT